MRKFLSFCFSCRTAFLAVLSYLFLFLFPACPGEENSGDENSPDTYIVDNAFDNNTDKIAEMNEENSDDNSTDTGIDPPEEVEAEATSSCEDYEMMNGTFDCCGENGGSCEYDSKCEIKECKVYCTDPNGNPVTLNGAPLPNEGIKILSETQFFIQSKYTICTKK